MRSGIGEKVVVAVIGAVIGAVAISASVWIWQKLSGGGLITALGGVSRSEYKNMVAAFDIDKGCPDGWSDFRRAEKRTIVGASFSESGKKNDPYGFRATEGKEDILLTKAHVPSHEHEYKDVYYSETDSKRPKSETKEVKIPQKKGSAGPIDHDNVGWALSRKTGSFGREDVKHTNMQPYIALYFCKWDEK